VLHVSQLKEFRPDYNPVFDRLPPHTDFSQQALQPEAVLEWRLVKKGNATILQVRIKWLDIPDVTWEDWPMLTAKFPKVKSWRQDGASAEGGSSLMGQESNSSCVIVCKPNGSCVEFESVMRSIKGVAL
jgi:hypothetical protein